MPLISLAFNGDAQAIAACVSNRQYVKNVFGTNWLPYVTSYYGYRVHF